MWHWHCLVCICAQIPREDRLRDAVVRKSQSAHKPLQPSRPNKLIAKLPYSLARSASTESASTITTDWPLNLGNEDGLWNCWMPVALIRWLQRSLRTCGVRCRRTLGAPCSRLSAQFGGCSQRSCNVSAPLLVSRTGFSSTASWNLA